MNSNNDIDRKISICDFMKEDSSEIIKKLESSIPSSFQNYSDLYTAYLHIIDDLFGTCYLAEKEFYDKLNIDQRILKQMKEFSRITKENYLEIIEMGNKMMNENVKMRMSAVKAYDSYFHTIMESYAKILSQYNNSFKQSD